MNALVPFAAAAMSVTDVEKIAGAIARGGLFGSSDPYAVLTLCLLAQAEGQHPAVVFRDYHIIKGKPAKKAEAMLRDFINAGGKIEWHQLDDTCADATFSHPAGGTARIAWNHERAKKAEIVNQMYRKFPRQMLRSRTISEGIRTIYPGATSGLYEEGEVAAFAVETKTIEQPPSETPLIGTGEVETAPREKVPGIHKIKQAIRAMKQNGNEVTDLKEFETTIAEYGPEMKALEVAAHSWWTGDDGEGGTFEGIPAWIERRRAELTPAPESVQFQLLMSTLAECETVIQLSEWTNKNMTVIDELDGAESRAFGDAYGARESAIHAMGEVGA